MSYTKVDNWLFDEVMPSEAVNPGAFKIIAAVVRSTAGWHKESDIISIGQFQAMTGIKGRSNVVGAIKRALDSGYIERRKSGDSYEYRVVMKRDQTDDSQSRKVTSASHETGLPASHETGLTKENEIKDKDPLAELVDHFLAVSSCRPPKNGRYADDWVRPLVAIYQAAGEDFNRTKLLIADAVVEMRGKQLTIATPASLQNIAVSLASNGRGERLEIGAI